MRADSWYRPMLEQLKTLENRGQFLRAEILDANRNSPMRAAKDLRPDAAKIQKRCDWKKPSKSRNLSYLCVIAQRGTLTIAVWHRFCIEKIGCM